MSHALPWIKPRRRRRIAAPLVDMIGDSMMSAASGNANPFAGARGLDTCPTRSEPVRRSLPDIPGNPPEHAMKPTIVPAELAGTAPATDSWLQQLGRRLFLGKLTGRA